MNFDNIEGLTSEEITELFEDSIDLSCGCSCRQKSTGYMRWSADIGGGCFCGTVRPYYCNSRTYWDSYCQSICNRQGIGYCNELYVGYFDGYYDSGIVWFCR